VRRVTASPEACRATVDAYIAAYRANDKDALLALYSDDCVWIDPVGTPAHHGREGVAKFWDDARAMADKIVLEPRQVHVCGNEAAAEIEIHATIGDATMIFDAVDVFEFDDDAHIKAGKAFWDMSTARTA
jgi:steroid delta-isomerase